MAVSNFKVGPGTLTFGSVGSVLDMTTQVTAARVSPTKDAEDSLTTLSGDTLGGAVTYGADLEVTAVQDDLDATGMIAWSWAHKGEEVPFTYTPNAALGRSITGTVTVDPIAIGGDVGAKNTSDFTWTCVGFPALGDDLT
jgi:hypothetical protein